MSVIVAHYQKLQYISLTSDCTIRVKLSKLVTASNYTKYNYANDNILNHSILCGNSASLI